MLNKFDYFLPATLKETFELLKNDNTCIISGGTDLLVNIRGSKIKPSKIIDIKNIASLKNIVKTKRGIEIGSLITMNELANANLLKGVYSILAQAASIMGCYEIRNRATLGGNIINASPGADTLTPLAVLNAKVIVQSSAGKRTIPLIKFITWVNTTALKKDEVLTKIILPPVAASAKGYYMRRQRVKGMDLASVNCSVFAASKNDIRISIGAVSPTPYRAIKAEKFLNGKNIDMTIIKKAAEIINSEISPRPSSLRATPEYKKLMTKTFLTTGFQKIFGVINGT